MRKVEIIEPVKPEDVRKAIKTLADHKFHERINRVDGHQAHITLSEIWPVIQEVCLIADACEIGMIEVRNR